MEIKTQPYNAPTPTQQPPTDNPYANYSDSAQIKHLEENFDRFADERHKKGFVTKHSLTEVAERDKNAKDYNKDDSDFARKLLSSKQLLSDITDFKRPIQYDDGVFISKSDAMLFNSYKDQAQTPQSISY